MVQNYLKPTTPSRSRKVRILGWCHSVGNQMAEVTKKNNIKIAAEMPIYAEKYEICTLC